MGKENQIVKIDRQIKSATKAYLLITGTIVIAVCCGIFWAVTTH